MKLISKIKDVIAQRRAICATCQNKKINALHLEACSLCGCPIASKTMAPGTSCPDNPPKW